MSDRENPPTDLLDAVCRLDDIADWLTAESYVDEAAEIRDVSLTLEGHIVISLKPKGSEGREP